MVVSAEDLREQGNRLLGKNQVNGAIDVYSRALEMYPSDHLLLSNRSAARLLHGDVDQALEDAEKCVELAPHWGKSYIRKMNALSGKGLFDEAIQVADIGCACVPESEKDIVSRARGKVQLDALHFRLRRQWIGRVSVELGGYKQKIILEENNAMRVEVFGRVQAGTYSLDMSQDPVVLTMTFGSGAKSVSVPYIIELRENSNRLAMCCPYLVTDLPTQFEGPGFVEMKPAETDVDDEPETETLKQRISEVTDPYERVGMYMKDFIAILSTSQSSTHDDVLGSPEADANAKVIEAMTLHSRISELEQLYGPEVAGQTLAIVSGGEWAQSAPAEVIELGERLKATLISAGFITEEALERVRSNNAQPTPQPSPAKSRLQKKLLSKKSALDGESLSDLPGEEEEQDNNTDESKGSRKCPESANIPEGMPVVSPVSILQRCQHNPVAAVAIVLCSSIALTLVARRYVSRS